MCMVKAGMKIYTLKSYTQKFIRIIIFINYNYPNIEKSGDKTFLKKKVYVVGDRPLRALLAGARGLGGPVVKAQRA